MAWVRKLPSGKYAGRYRGPDSKVRTVAGGPFTHKRAAERAAASAEEDSRQPGWRGPEAGRKTWREWCGQWWPSRTVEVSTLKTDAGRRDVHLMPRWGDVALADITRHDVKAWAADLTAGRGPGARKALAPATTQRVVHLLSASLAAAVDAEILPANPAARLRLGGGSPAVERYLTAEEYQAVRAHLDDEHRVMADLLVNTGMRWGEAAGLHAARVDRERGVVMVAEVWSAKARAMKGYPKGRRRREVPLPKWVELPAVRPGECGYQHGGARCRGGLAVTTAAGAILDDSMFRRVFAAAAVAAGVGHVRVHDLRHTYASWLLQDGVPLAEVGKLLGHESPITTQRYAHLAETPRAAVLDALRHGAEMAQPDAQRRSGTLRVIKGGKAG
ncbi:MAG: tyrosine-type recombinase/integrase [Georgenia sp.]